ncbi:AI-2E family transporter [Pontibacter pamirensis]|uniref:AI-2E family transporter n=1 Tax=Pontibacter pamirensis TaxID=2562824 RepID=UPI0013894B54|nr:AI-2E family transporter [Pontibacter pamirensis]
MENKRSRLQQFTIILLFGLLLVYVLVEARDFLYPVFIAVLFAYLLYPVVKKLEDWGVPRILANFITIITAVAVFVGLVFLLYKQLTTFLSDFPALQQNAMQNVDRLQEAIDEKFGSSDPDDEQWLRTQVNNALEVSGGFVADLLMTMTDTLTKVGLMPVYIFLMLYYRNKFENVIYRQLSSYKHTKAKRLIDEVSNVTKNYMRGIVIVILILCVINTSGLLLIGVEYAIMLGIMSALMNFIPYFGTLIGGAIPLTYTLLVQGSPQKALWVLLFFLLVQFTENNILTPNITGSQVNINPMVTILSIVLGAMIWGLPGMFVVVPFLGMFKVYCDYQDDMRAWSYMLGTEGTEEHALTIDKIKKWFKSKF